MNKLAALIDFTPTCEVTLSYLSLLTKTLGTEAVLVNVEADQERKALVEAELELYAKKIRNNELECATHVEVGDFNAIIDSTLQLLNPQLVITGTHGIKGLKQTLFGAHILKLAQNISIPLLVVQDESKLNPKGIQNILFSMGPHEKFEATIDFVASLAKDLNSRVVIYTIIKSAQDLSDELTYNNNYAKRVLEAVGVPFEHVIEESQDFSLGFSRQTIHYMEKNPFDLVVMPADASEMYRAFSKMDKENLILNSPGVPVLCV
ncbi:MAG: universal stress protein [Bacteroidia bacterium]